MVIIPFMPGKKPERTNCLPHQHRASNLLGKAQGTKASIRMNTEGRKEALVLSKVSMETQGGGVEGDKDFGVKQKSR